MVSNYDQPGNRLVQNAPIENKTAAKVADTCGKRGSHDVNSHSKSSLIKAQNSWRNSSEWSKMTTA
jgi:hypothetical protein